MSHPLNPKGLPSALRSPSRSPGMDGAALSLARGAAQQIDSRRGGRTVVRPAAQESAEETYVYTCRLATTANHALSGLSAIDGVTPDSGDRILVWQQSTASENGIYEAVSGTWIKLVSFTAALNNLYKVVAVSGGTLYGKTWFNATAANTLSGMGAYYL